ncbi:MAG: hypothetical protein AUJ21_00030 [Anaerolineae bacterium CG1_02_58_13]|nr:MAG: hypothetical protein AUJ21_00030 [Anaerolineae bacterium CG1_02_58_13]
MMARRFGPLSLRARLILSSILITGIAIAGMGYYVYYRAQQANAYLTNQLDESVRQQAEDKLIAASTEQAAALDNFFSSMRKDISTIGATTAKLISQEALLNHTDYWNASQALSRLPNGSWDNPNTETASVFIPAKVELTDSLISELNTIRQLDFIAATVLEANPDTVAVYFGGVSGETLYYPNIDLAAIVPPDFDVTKWPWFVKAAPAQNPGHKAAWSDPYLDAALHGLVVTASIPVFDSAGNFRGVAAEDIQLNRITDIVSNIHVGQTGYAFLIDQGKRLIAIPEAGYKSLGVEPDTLPLGEVLEQTKVSIQVPPEFWAALAKMAAGQSELETMPINGVEHFVVYRPVPETGYSLAIIVPAQELLAGAISAREQVALVTKNTITASIFLVGAILILALLAAVGMGNSLTKPLSALTKIAEEIAGGNLNAEAKVRGQDEIGTLARAFNSMTAQLRGLVGSLEARVAERTSALERRALQIQAAAEIGNAAASMRNLDELLAQAARLISQRFGFYHTGIFMLDARGEYAVLRASNSPGGQRMLSRAHRLKVGEVGIVGYVSGKGEARIALDVGQDAVFFDNPDLPGTHSEMALPLKAGGKILGALDVQSTEKAAFSEEDVSTLQILADQLAVAIENAGLFAENQAALEAARRAYGEIAAEAWKQRLQTGTNPGYVSAERENPVSVEKAAWSPESRRALQERRPVMGEDGAALSIPILLRGQAIGALRLVKPHPARWTEDEIQTAQTLSDQLSGALDSARLYDESQRRAAKERAIGEITSRVGDSINVRDIMQSAVEELGRALAGSEVTLQLREKE